jgi:TonB dependent receptor/TonB-dependent Receptor Plug Domain
MSRTTRRTAGRPAAALAGLTASLASLGVPCALADAADGAAADNGLTTVVVEASSTAGPAVSPAGANDYAASANDIAASPQGKTAPLTDVLAQMPGVAIDQNQQIHIRNTEGPQFQYQINGVLIPLDINTNPPFLSMINPMFIKRLDLLDGVLPARYSYATGGVVNIQTRDGCDEPAFGELSLRAGQRDTLEPGFEYSGCDDGLGTYVSGLYQQSNTAFSSATPGPTPIHDFTHQEQLFGFFSYPLTPSDTLSLIVSGAASRNQLPNVPGLAPQYALAGVPVPPSSAEINSYLDFSDALAVLSLSGSLGDSGNGAVAYQLAATWHTISQRFEPDPVGELIYQGVASTATHDDHDTTLEGDLSFTSGAHTLGGGFYLGQYRVSADDSSLVFAANDSGEQLSDVPLTVVNNAHSGNVVAGLYVSDLWRLSPNLSASAGLRWDTLSGFTNDHQLDPSINVVYQAGSATFHSGFARYFQVPSFLGISPTAQDAFAGTTAAGPPGVPTPLTEDDREWDTGVVLKVTPHLSVAADGYYEWTTHYLDTGQFGVVPIFAPFNYDSGHVWGGELSAHYQTDSLTAYASATLGRNWQRGVVTGQFNFPADELAYIDAHAIVLDHQPLYGASAGASWQLGAYALAVDGIYSSGLRAGFADLEPLPPVVQLNLSAERSWRIRGVGVLTNRLTVLNVLDRVNLIRPAEGIGIFQSAYGPRLTFYDTVTLRF